MRFTRFAASFFLGAGFSQNGPTSEYAAFSCLVCTIGFFLAFVYLEDLVEKLKKA